MAVGSPPPRFGLAAFSFEFSPPWNLRLACVLPSPGDAYRRVLGKLFFPTLPRPGRRLKIGGRARGFHAFYLPKLGSAWPRHRDSPSHHYGVVVRPRRPPGSRPYTRPTHLPWLVAPVPRFQDPRAHLGEGMSALLSLCSK